MAYVSDSNLSGALARLGNVPGDHEGDCLLVLPNGSKLEVASGQVTVYTEGVVGVAKDGRRFFVSSGGAVLIDAPAQVPDPTT